MRTIRTVAELPRHLARRARRAHVGLVPTMGAFHAGHDVADPRGARAHRRRRRVAVRQPGAVQRRRATSPRTPATRRSDAASRRGARRRRAVRPRAGRGLSRRLRARRSRVDGPLRRLRGRRARPGPLRRRLHRRREAAEHGRAGRRLLRPEGRPAGRRRAADGRAISTSRSSSTSGRRSASRTGSRCRAATSASAPTSGPARPASSAALPRRGRRTAYDGRLAAVLDALRHRRPSTSPLVDPGTLPAEPGRPARRSPRTIGATRLIDNVLIKRAATPDRRGADPKGAVSVLPAP